ncbi:Abi-alpha family protein [Oryzomonas rubra]|uniref:DUF4393 domain-containing protein n=1 Tax=Oryzomonas rubra TaxID=2509454 RepID=A0A5A9X4I6_9BACT|nr:Abi-alpha family protein [Oryzomonas rubra]KAA0887987.1 DUF4393 domain-containing protein [Oryzomonas rubra]
MTDELKESAKAIQEVAKTAGKAIDLSDKFGQFISRYVGTSLSEAFGIFEDKLKYMRWERQVRLMQRANDFLLKEGFSQPTQAIPMKFAVPLLEAASLEDDDYLQDLWAKLIVNAAIEESDITINRTFIDILERLSPLEAKILDVVYAIPYEDMHHNGVDTRNLPNSAQVFPENSSNIERMEPSEDVKLALANLDRLGCISVSHSMGGGQLFGTLNPTLLGKRFFKACKLPSERAI